MIAACLPMNASKPPDRAAPAVDASTPGAEMIEPVARAAMLAAMLQAGHPQRWRFCAEPLEEGSALARIAAYDEAGSFAGYL